MRIDHVYLLETKLVQSIVPLARQPMELCAQSLPKIKLFPFCLQGYKANWKPLTNEIAHSRFNSVATTTSFPFCEVILQGYLEAANLYVFVCTKHAFPLKEHPAAVLGRQATRLMRELTSRLTFR